MTHWINGQWQKGDKVQFQSYRPDTNEIIWQGRNASSAQVDDAVLAAKTAFSTWGKLSVSARDAIIHAFESQLILNQQALAELIATETGKPLWETKGEVTAMINKIAISRKAYHERTGTSTQTQGNTEVKLRHRPLGVLAVFGPYNFPAHLPNGHIIPALIAGNTIVFKPSEQTPAVGEMMAKCWQQAGLPNGVINMVQGERSVGEWLANHQDIDGLLFTGSSNTGKLLHRAFAGSPEKMLALEMGGNNPLVISESFGDLKAAVYTVLQSAFVSAGQRCTCSRRLFVPNGAKGNEFIEALLNAVSNLTIGGPFDQPAPFFGPVISSQAADAIINAEQNLIELGGQVLIKAMRGEAAFVTPSVIDVTQIKNLPDEEYFGPLLQIIRYDKFSTAVELANKTRYGLSAGLISTEQAQWDYFCEHIQAGIVNWNCPLTGASSQMPFGGIGASGNGRASAYYAADYCAYPMASMLCQHTSLPETLAPGISL